ncbi:DedA family protein [Micrococcus cohnii]|uniref:Membrane protein DedA with SNARE-associated domain n=1 Tax=Micrococcus cohnii TaxID=993416 RepID=A0A7W7GQJ6_9MICC|nr:VTT domain-containing protein [Micrococcus cohnii]MBB4736491.1 membrane protein DedA with SNARE-associated domain [Micrococcus cohnii]
MSPAELFEHLGGWFYLITAGLVALDAPVPPTPSELFVIGSGALASTGDVGVVPAILAAWLGCWAGDIGLYALFRHRLTHVLDRWGWGRRVHRGIRSLLAKAGPAPSLAGLFVLRFVSGGRTASMAAAGIAGIRWRVFLWFSGLGAFTWSCYMVGLGWLTGEATGLPWWVSAVMGMVLGTLAGLVIAGIVAWRRRAEAGRGPGER